MRRLFLVIALCSLAFAPAPLPRREARQGDDVQRIRGSWLMIAVAHEGKPGISDNTRWVFGTDAMQIVNGGNKYDWSYVIDPRATPRALDMTFGPKGNATTLKCVYSFDGDVLKIGYNAGKWNERPASEKDAEYLMTFRRER